MHIVLQVIVANLIQSMLPLICCIERSCSASGGAMGGRRPPAKGGLSVLQLDCDTTGTGSRLPRVRLFCLLAMREKSRGELKPTHYYHVRVLRVRITLWCPLGDDIAITTGRWARCQPAADNRNFFIALRVGLRDVDVRVFFIRVCKISGNLCVFFRRVTVRMSASGMCGGGNRNFDGLNKCIQPREGD